MGPFLVVLLAAKKIGKRAFDFLGQTILGLLMLAASPSPLAAEPVELFAVGLRTQNDEIRAINHALRTEVFQHLKSAGIKQSRGVDFLVIAAEDQSFSTGIVNFQKRHGEGNLPITVQELVGRQVERSECVARYSDAEQSRTVFVVAFDPSHMNLRQELNCLALGYLEVLGQERSVDVPPIIALNLFLNSSGL